MYVVGSVEGSDLHFGERMEDQMSVTCLSCVNHMGVTCLSCVHHHTVQTLVDWRHSQSLVTYSFY